MGLKWREVRLKVIFGNPKWPPTTILYIYILPFCENKSCVLIWNDRKWFSVILNGPNRTSKNFFLHIAILWKTNLRIDLKWREMWSKVIFRSSCKPFGDIHSIFPWANTPILVRICTWVVAYLYVALNTCPHCIVNCNFHNTKLANITAMQEGLVLGIICM